jgi:hypothetical protein
MEELDPDLSTLINLEEIRQSRKIIMIASESQAPLAVNQGGAVDYALARSVPLGIQTVIQDFEESFRANNLEIVKDTPVLPPDRVRKAIASGVFIGGGRRM